ELSWALDPSTMVRDMGVTPDAWQETLLRSVNDRVMILAYRQAGKSLAAATLALHSALFRPESLNLIISRSQRQADELFHKVVGCWRRLGRPRPVAKLTASEVAFEGGSRIISLPPSPDTVVGFSDPAMIILDEAARILD